LQTEDPSVLALNIDDIVMDEWDKWMDIDGWMGWIDSSRKEVRYNYCTKNILLSMLGHYWLSMK